MNKNKIVSLILVFTLLLTLFPYDLNIVNAEDQGLTYDSLKTAVITIFGEVDNLDDFERSTTISVLKHYVQIDSDENQNGIDDGIDDLVDIILSFDTENPNDMFGETFITNVKNELNLHSITIAQAANALKLLTIWDAEYRVEVIESLDSDNPILFFNPIEEDILVQELQGFPTMALAFEAQQTSIDEFSFFAFAVNSVIGDAIFVDDIDSSIRFIDSNRFHEIVTALDNALIGTTINGKQFIPGTVHTLFSSIDAPIGSFEFAIKMGSSGLESAVKGIFANHQLYSNSPTIKLVPVNDIVDENESLEVDVVLRNGQSLNINSLQINVDYSGKLEFLDVYHDNGSLLDTGSPEYNEYPDYVEVINADTPNVFAYGFTYISGGTRAITSDEEVIATLEFDGKSQGQAQINLDDVIMLTPDNVEITGYDILNTAVEVKGVAQAVPPQITMVCLENQPVSENETVTVSEDTLTVKGLVDPKTSEVKINGQNVTVHNIKGEFSEVLTYEDDGEYTISIVAENDGETDTFTFNIVIDRAGPKITIDGVEDNGLYNTNKEITINVEDGTLTSAELNGSPFTSGDSASVPEGQEQDFTLIVTAEDELGNITEQTVTFRIDNKDPKIVVVGVEEGEAYGRTRALIGIDEGTYIATLNGEDYASGTIIDTTGSYTLVITATDEARNQSEQTINFTIDGEAPAIEDGTIVVNPTIMKSGDTVNISFETTEVISEGYLNVGYIKLAIPLTKIGTDVSASFTISEDINAKNVPLKVVLVDDVGNVSDPIEIGTITIDNIPPRVFAYEADTVEYKLNNYIVSDTLELNIITDGNRIVWDIDGGQSTPEESNNITVNVPDTYADGNSHTINFVASDEANNSNTGIFTFKWDKTAPEKPVIENTDTITKEDTISLTGIVENGATIIVKKLINGTPVPVNYVDALPATVHLSGGSNSFIIRAVDQAGNESIDSEIYTIEKDSRKPLIKIDKKSNTELTITSNETLQGAPTAEYFIDKVSQGELSVSAVAGSENTYTVTGMDLDAVGKHQIKAIGTDLAGNEGFGHYTTVTVPQEITEDIELTDNLTLDDQTDDGALDGKLQVRTVEASEEEGQEFVSEPVEFSGVQITTGSSVVITLQLEPGLPENTKLYYYDEENDEWIKLDEDPIHGDSSYDPITGILTATLKHFSTYGAMADTTAPEVVITLPTEGDKIAAADLTNSKIEITGTVSEDATFEISVNDGGFNSVDANITGNDFKILLDPGIDGDKKIEIRAKDGSDNVSEVKVINVSLDTTAPVIDKFVAASSTKENPEEITLNTSDINNVTAKVYLNVIDESNLVFTTDTKGSDVKIPVDLTEGDNNFIVVATDEFGNSVQESKTIKLDTVGPTITISGVSDGDVVGDDITITIGLDETGTWTADLDKDGSDCHIFDHNTGSYTVNVSIGESHTYKLRVDAQDELGNINFEEIEFTIDDRLPSISVAGVNDGDITKEDVTIDVSSTDADSLSFALNKEGKATVFDNGDTLDQDGEYELIIIATKDVSGNNLVATKTINFIIDKVDPVITISGVSNGRTYTGSVTPIISVTDNHSATNNITVTATLNGSDFTSGTTVSEKTSYTLAVTATDEAGNESTETYTFTITQSSTGGGGSSGGGGGGSAPSKEAKSIATSGGKLELLDQDIIINIPKGTFDTKVKITVEEIDKEDVKLPKETPTTKLKIAGRIFEFSAEGKKFNKPITVTLPYYKSKASDPMKLGVYLYNEDTKTWEYIGGKVDPVTRTVTVMLNHFSKYAVMEYSKSFTDLDGHWAKSDIELMAARHVANGITESTFVPNGNITRAQFATYLVRALGLELSTTSSKFTDVGDNAWYAKYVMTAYEAGLVNGISDTEFAPQTNITREQMAVMTMRAFNALTGEDYKQIMVTTQVRFNDEAEMSSWAHHAVMVANSKGISNGMTADTFAPKANATRAQGIVMIKRLLSITDKL